jgi:hypothetical protein
MNPPFTWIDSIRIQIFGLSRKGGVKRRRYAEAVTGWMRYTKYVLVLAFQMATLTTDRWIPPRDSGTVAVVFCKIRLKCDGTRAETIFRLSAKRMSPFKSAGASVQPNTDSRGVRISCSNAG